LVQLEKPFKKCGMWLKALPEPLLWWVQLRLLAARRELAQVLEPARLQPLLELGRAQEKL
jgi:hypothetical protein